MIIRPLMVVEPFRFILNNPLEPDVPHLINSIARKMNEVIDRINELTVANDGVQSEFVQIREEFKKQLYSLNIPEYTREYINELADSGKLAEIVGDYILGILNGGEVDAIPSLVETAVENWLTDESGTDYLASLVMASIDATVSGEISTEVNRIFADEMRKYFTIPANSENVVSAKNGVTMPSNSTQNFSVTYSADSANGKPIIIVENKTTGEKSTYALTLTKV